MATSSSALVRPLSASGAARTGRPAADLLRSRLLTSHRLAFSPLVEPRRRKLPCLVARAKPTDASAGRKQQTESKNSKGSTQTTFTGELEDVEEGEEVEEEMPWIEEKALDLVEFTGTVTQAIPGPRVGRSPLPWLLAVPLAFLGVSFVISVVKTVKKFTSPRAQRKRLVNKNAVLLKSIDELFKKGKDEVNYSALQDLARKTDFNMEEILRKYIRYVLNEKPFNPELVMDLIYLRKASGLEDTQVAEILNEVSRRIVKEKGPVVMDLSRFTERGFKRKLAVQTLFGKIFYLSELPELCSRDSSLIVKEIFGVTDDDADTLRLHTLSETDDIESIKKMADDPE